MTTMSITNSAGIPTLLNFSIPPETPPLTMSMHRPTNRKVNIAQPNWFSSIAPKVLLPVMAAPNRLLRPKPSSAKFRNMYWKQ